jgi:glycosyltransferase involved in cell wall biosynthesis
MKPDISIIVPTMRVGGLDVVFKGLSQQSFQNFELILVDGIHQYRKDLVFQKSQEYRFTVKHVEPTKKAFPVANFCNTSNTGIINASADLLLLITDYTYLPSDCVEKHIKFHTDFPAENVGYMCPHQYHSLPELSPNFTPYHQATSIYATTNEQTEAYVEDIKTGKLKNVMWSIFKNDFDQDPKTLPLDSIGKIDIKFTLPFEVADWRTFNAKNESIKTEAALKINGYDEDFDEGYPYQDSIFSLMLTRKLNFIWLVDKDNIAHIINPRFVMPFAKRLRTPEDNLAMLNRKNDGNFPQRINDWDLREIRNHLVP